MDKPILGMVKSVKLESTPSASLACAYLMHCVTADLPLRRPKVYGSLRLTMNSDSRKPPRYIQITDVRLQRQRLGALEPRAQNDGTTTLYLSP